MVFNDGKSTLVNAVHPLQKYCIADVDDTVVNEGKDTLVNAVHPVNV